MDEVDTIQQIDDALETLPKEVKDFLYNGEFERALTTLCQKFSLSADQKMELDFHLTQVIILLEHDNDLIRLCERWNFTPQQKESFMESVIQTVIVPIIQATNYIIEEDTEESILTQNAPSPADVLASLKARLTTPSSIAPVVRELPPGQTSVSPSATTVASSQKKTVFDPYRELPGK